MKRLACIALALATFAWLLLATAWYFRLPFYGFEVPFYPDDRVLRLADGAVVQQGDRVKSVNGRALEEPDDLGTILGEAAGAPVKLDVERDGERLELVQRALPHSPRVVLSRVAGALASLVLLAVGLLVVLRPTGTPGRVFFLFCVAVSALLGGLPEHFGSELFRRLAVNVLIAALLFSGALLLHFFLLFPRPHRLLSRFPRLVRLLYAPPAISLLLIFAINLIPPSVAKPFIEEGSLYARVAEVLVIGLVLGALVVLAVYLIGAVAVFVDSYRRQEEPVEREKLRWVVWGVAVSILPSAALLVLENIARVYVPYSDVWWPLTMLLLPVSFGYAILSHRIMDIEIVFNRGLVYTIVTGIMLVVFLVVENLLAALSLELSGATSFGIAMGAAVVMAVLLDPVKSRVEAVVERLFFAYRLRLREGLRDLAQELSFVTHLERMEQLLVRRLVDLAHARGAALFLRDEAGGFEVVEAFQPPAGDARHSRPLELPSAGFRFGVDDGLVLWLLREGAPLSLEKAGSELDQRLEPTELDLLRRMEAALVVPLRLRGEMVGFLVLSSRRNWELFDHDEVALLQNLAPQAAADLTTARLRGRSTDLERENVALREELLARFRTSAAAEDGAGAGEAQRLASDPGSRGPASRFSERA